MFAALERQMLSVLKFRINMPTPLDFALYFAHRAYEVEAAQDLIFQCVPFVYTVVCDYDLSREQTPSVIGLASILEFVQHNVPDSSAVEQLTEAIINGLDTSLICQANNLVEKYRARQADAEADIRLSHKKSNSVRK